MARPYTYTHEFAGLTIEDLRRDLGSWEFDHKAGLISARFLKNRRGKIEARIKRLENQKTAA